MIDFTEPIPYALRHKTDDWQNKFKCRELLNIRPQIIKLRVHQFLASCCMFCVCTFSFSQFGIPFLSTSRHPIFVIFVTEGHTCMWAEENHSEINMYPSFMHLLEQMPNLFKRLWNKSKWFLYLFLKRHLIPAAVVLSSVLYSDSSRLWRCLKCMLNGNHRWLLAEVSLRA